MGFGDCWLMDLCYECNGIVNFCVVFCSGVMFGEFWLLMNCLV